MCHDLSWWADKHFLRNFLVHCQIIFILHDRTFKASCIMDSMMLGYMAGSSLQLDLRRHLMARKWWLTILLGDGRLGLVCFKEYNSRLVLLSIWSLAVLSAKGGWVHRICDWSALWVVVFFDITHWPRFSVILKRLVLLEAFEGWGVGLILLMVALSGLW